MRIKFQNYILALLLTIQCSMLLAQTNPIVQPRLVVGIMVDGLQQNHIEFMLKYFDSNGLRKIIEKGTNCANVRYNIVSAGNASDIANVMTGTTAYYNGVSGNKYYNKTEKQIQSILYDDNELGIGTKLNVSAHNLLSSTVLDELSLSNSNKSKSHAIAINAEDAIMMGGHTANSAVWIDDQQLKWVSTGYYLEGLNRWAEKMNSSGDFNNTVNRKWEPMFNINTYNFKPKKGDKRIGFEYDPKSKQGQNSAKSILKSTPLANTLVTDLACKIIVEDTLGRDKYCDMLMLQYTTKTPYEKTAALQTAEKEDMYLRLDKDFQRLLQKIDLTIGLDKTLIFMFSNQTGVHSPSELGKNKIPAGYFNANRSLALLSTYLMAVYGQEKWIEGYYAKNIYLNKKKIEEKKIKLSEMQQTIADFMPEFEGIQAAITSNQLMNMTPSENSVLEKIQNSFVPKIAGDIILTLMPGWIEVDDNNNPIGESNSILSNATIYFYGLQIPSKKILNSYSTSDIAPTLSRLLNITFPNACTGKPIEELFTK